eukprot:3359328-Lingulodinium_polyedra.AAC.1
MATQISHKEFLVVMGRVATFSGEHSDEMLDSIVDAMDMTWRLKLAERWPAECEALVSVWDDACSILARRSKARADDVAAFFERVGPKLALLMDVALAKRIAAASGAELQDDHENVAL